VAVHALRVPGTSLTQAVHMQKVLETRLAKLPEVERVFSRIGTSEVANDPMPPSMTDTFVMMKSRESWPDPRKSKAELLEDIETVARALPGNNYEFTQPI
jgi:cobalt-zinc-cadmium resistance protein CzcA